MKKENENIVDNFVQDKRYKALEKITHESQMRIKSYMIENAIYFSPIILTIVGWFMWATFRNSSLPYGQNYDFFQPLFFILIGIGVGLTFLFLKYAKPYIKSAFDREEKELTEDVYKKGARLSTVEMFNEQIGNFLEDEKKHSADKKVSDLFRIPLDNDEYMLIPRISLSTGLAILGAPGQGKSVLINRIIEEIELTPGFSKDIIIDVKGEFVEKFYNPETDYIICPSDIRSSRFDIVNLLHTHIDTGIIAEILIAEDKQTQDPHWVASARSIMEGVLIYSAKRNLSNTEIYEMISSPLLLKEMVENDDDARLVAGSFLQFSGDEMSKETQSILSSLARKAKTLQYLRYLDDNKTDKIYLDEWLQNDKPGKLFLLATENLSKVFTPLYGVIASYLISTLLDAEDTTKKNYYFVLDELPRLGKALGENLEKGLAVGRSKGAKFIMAMQSNSQLVKEFGKEASESILDTTNSVFVFKSNLGAQFVEKLFGKTTLIRNNESFSFGMAEMADRSQLARQLTKESLVDEAEITRLSKFEFYAKIEGCKDILLSKLAPKFIKGIGNNKYMPNPAMNINVLVEEMHRKIKMIENKYVSFSKARKTQSTSSISVDF